MSVGGERLVAKYGGTSMAMPDIVAEHLQVAGNQADVVIVSAPGKDPTHPIKLTDIMVKPRRGRIAPEDVQHRFGGVLDRTGRAKDPNSLLVIKNIPNDLQAWHSLGYPLEALGEYWSAKLFAVQTGRQFIDAKDVVCLDVDGEVNIDRTASRTKALMPVGGEYVVPGFYGSLPDGQIKTLGRGGSDITGDIMSRALGAREYHNCSDVDGFMSADPRKVGGATLLETITYREARELGNGGSELLHREVIKHLGGTGIRTTMKNTFDLTGKGGTTVVDERLWQLKPLIGVTGRDDLTAVNLHEFGLNEGIGQTLDLKLALKEAEVPYEHSNDATDDVALYVDRKHRAEVEEISANLSRKGRRISTTGVGLIHIVGEGLAQSGTMRLWSLGKVGLALAEAGIEGRGVADVSGSATQTFFIKPQSVTESLSVAHRALGLAG